VSGGAKVYAIPAGVPFLDALAAGICAETGDDPVALSRVTVLLPTRRACRSLREAFLRRTDGRPMLLPRLRPVGDVDDDEIAFADEGGLDLPPAIAPLRRRLMLARAILKLDAGPDPQGKGGERTPPQAVELATELAKLLDQVQTERVGFAGLENLAPEDLADHWWRTVEFLGILTAHWPAILEAEGAIDPADRRDRALATLKDRWSCRPPAERIIAAGSTGSIPATADLLAVIARLPRGAVVLPGLDRDLDEESWQAVDDSHPQYGLRELLGRLAIGRDAVQDWPHGVASPQAAARRQLMSAAMRPAATTGSWRAGGALPREAVEGLAYIETAHAQEEAQVVALLLREALETPGRTAALVTPDRDLARRVAAELGRFGIGIDDSAGRPLAATPPVTFLRLIAEALADGAAPAPLLAALKHPLAGGGLATAEFRARTRALETAVLRGPRPGPRLGSVVAALRDADQPLLADWLTRLADQARAFTDLAAGAASPADLLRAHVTLAEAWAATDSEPGPSRLWTGEAGEAAAEFVAELDDAARDFPAIHGGAYPAFLEHCLVGRVVRPVWGGHPRLHILGPLEARLLSFDLLVLGGLNEGTWPLDVAADPWMSRPMRKAFGLPAPERRIGLAAHDFAQACAAPTVVLTRATRVEGTPTVPSRWLQRLRAVLRAAQLPIEIGTRVELTHWRDALDRAAPLPAAGPPAPCPPVRARPRQLSVTEIEKWLRDPYAIYARHVLKLEKLEPLDADPGAAERGQIVHEALHAFVDKFPGALPGDAVERLLEIGRREFGPALARPGVWAFWWPRFEAIARWFVTHEAERRREAVPLVAEGHGTLVLAGPAGDFTLTARADRIDRLADGSLAIIDYKTGGVPTKSDIVAGLAPQLPLEAAIARAGRFAGVPAAPVTQLRYWRLAGGDPAGEEIALDNESSGRRSLPEPVALADEALAGLTTLIARFDDPATRYLARPRPDHALRYNDYAHLARVKEWSAEDGA
jgi:ATP-dependent helicase/nuclease subunit B